MNKIAILGIVTLVAVLTVSTASAGVTVYFIPQDISVPEGEGHSAYVEVWMEVEDPDSVKGGQFAIHYDPACVNITKHPVALEPEGWGPCLDYTVCSWNAYPECGGGPGYNMIMYTWAYPIPHPPFCPSPQMMANFTVECLCSDYCVSNLSVTCGEDGCSSCPIEVRKPDGTELYPDNVTLVDGTFICGAAPPLATFEKGLVAGWNMISLPLYNETDMTVTTIIGDSLSGSYSDLYSYNASTDDFVALGSSDTMQNGLGYFIYMTTIDTWIYSGIPYNRVEVSLSEGLNCIGWTNTSANINATEENALGSITDKYNYVAQWNNAPSPKYEVYEQHAPDVFNDFWALERGGGYWIAANEDCTLTYT